MVQVNLGAIEMNLDPVVLEGTAIRLEPLDQAHAAPLWAVGQDSEIWRWMPFPVHAEDDRRRLIAGAQHLNQAGSGLGYAVIAKETGEPVGSTGYWNAAPEHRRVEIGATWIAPRWQRAGVNTEAKYLMLRHAFEQLACLRVEFKTDARNTRSREALRRLGATEEGTLRHHMINPGGGLRDSVYYSIIAPEWPSVRAHLERLMSSY